MKMEKDKVNKNLLVIKIGGALFKQGIDSLLDDMKNLIEEEYQFVIVHGGGPQINWIEKEMGREPKIYETKSGMKTRHTDQETMEVVKMALGGYVNKSIVEQCQLKGINAFGFSGVDGRTLSAKRKEKIMVMRKGRRMILRGEFSGKVHQANCNIIKYLLSQNMTPVIGSIAADEEGNAVNTDGDRATSAIAAELGAAGLISLTDVEGIYRDFESKEVIPQLNLAQAKGTLEKVKGGMKKKLYAAIEALEKGLNQVFIYSGQVETPISDILKQKKGTKIHIN